VTILEAVAAEPNGLTLSALARQIGVPNSTVHTLVQGLLATDFLAEQSGQLALGAGVELLASSRVGHRLRGLAHGELITLAANADETAHLFIRSGDSVIMIDQVESNQPIRYAVTVRRPRPMLTTSTGKLFLAEMEIPELESFLAAHGETNSRAAATIRAQREAIRRQGIAYNLEESIPGVATMAAPVRGATGTLLAGLVAAGPAERIRPKFDHIEPMLREAAKRISEQLK
jgi:DNA-binding IclR family transcriptional regulator